MSKITKLTGLLAVTLMTAMGAVAAQAQATRTWVSGNGNDSNPCSYTAPCKTFAGAYLNTAVNGEIDAIDAGGYGTVTIAKSITIDGGGGHVASILASGTNGITISGAGVVVTLRNLNLQGVAGAGLAGITFLNGAQLNVLNCEIQGFGQYGLNFTPSVAGSRLFVQNTTIHNDPGYGVVIGPTVTSGAYTKATLDGVHVFQNGIGVRVSDNARVLTTRSDISDNSFDGVSVAATSVPAFISLEETAISNNGGNGISLSGAGHPIVRVSNTYIATNVGASFLIGAGGDVDSFGNNRIIDNGTNTPPNGSFLQQ